MIAQIAVDTLNWFQISMLISSELFRRPKTHSPYTMTHPTAEKFFFSRTTVTGAHTITIKQTGPNAFTFGFSANRSCENWQYASLVLTCLRHIGVKQVMLKMNGLPCLVVISDTAKFQQAVDNYYRICWKSNDAVAHLRAFLDVAEMLRLNNSPAVFRLIKQEFASLANA